LSAFVSAYLEDARAPEAVSEVAADDARHGVAREEGGEDEALLREGPVEVWREVTWGLRLGGGACLDRGMIEMMRAYAYHCRSSAIWRMDVARLERSAYEMAMAVVVGGTITGLLSFHTDFHSEPPHPHPTHLRPRAG
jgi:hypothetical protein